MTTKPHRYRRIRIPQWVPVVLCAGVIVAQVGVAVTPAPAARVTVLTPTVTAYWIPYPGATPGPWPTESAQVRPSPPPSLYRPTAPARASRSLNRPPLAEESRWRSTSPVASASSGASASPHSVTPTEAVAASSSAPTDLERAESLPQPWRAIVRCESLDDRSYLVSSPSRARGFFQFLRSTWRSLGLSGDPAAAPFWKQYAAALRLAVRDGIRHSWVCARQLGL